MPGINLYQPDAPETQTRSLSEKTLLLSLVLLVLVLGLFGGLRLYNMYHYDQEIAKIDLQIAETSKKLDSETATEVYDFSKRLETMKETIAMDPKRMTEYLAVLQKAVVPDSRITSFEYDKSSGQITISGVAGSLETVAKQIRSLKMQPDFTEAAVKDLGVDSREDGTTYQRYSVTVPLNQ